MAIKPINLLFVLQGWKIKFMKISHIKVIGLFSLALFLILAGCAFLILFWNASLNEKTVTQLSAHYKQYHDYKSLVALLPYLNYTMKRSEVEDLLGKPTACNIRCFYDTDESFIVFCPDKSKISRATCQSFPIMLGLGYNSVDKNTESPQDQLAGFGLTPIGE